MRAAAAGVGCGDGEGARDGKAGGLGLRFARSAAVAAVGSELNMGAAVQTTRRAQLSARSLPAGPTHRGALRSERVAVGAQARPRIDVISASAAADAGRDHQALSLKDARVQSVEAMLMVAVLEVRWLL